MRKRFIRSCCLRWARLERGRNERINGSQSIVCPVCGKTEFREVCDYEICPICGWENGDSTEADPPFNLGLVEYKKRYGTYLALYPDYTWEKRGCPEITEEEECRLAHGFSQSNEAEILSSERCGCFFCLKVFDSGEVHDWLNDGGEKTALCPYCGVDSVLPDSKVELSKDFLEKMYEVWFGSITE